MTALLRFWHDLARVVTAPGRHRKPPVRVPDRVDRMADPTPNLEFDTLRARRLEVRR